MRTTTTRFRVLHPSHADAPAYSQRISGLLLARSWAVAAPPRPRLWQARARRPLLSTRLIRSSPSLRRTTNLMMTLRNVCHVGLQTSTRHQRGWETTGLQSPQQTDSRIGSTGWKVSYTPSSDQIPLVWVPSARCVCLTFKRTIGGTSKLPLSRLLARSVRPPPLLPPRRPTFRA